MPPTSPRPAPPPPAGDLLAEYGLPGCAPVDQLAAVTRVAATVCGVPNAVVNLLDGCFQHQVGPVGFAGGSSPAADSMCAAALREDRLRYLPDARQEPAFAGNPWVDGRLAAVRLYASAPLRLADGRLLGSLCVFSDEPGELSRRQLDALADLADQAVALFEQSRLARRAAEQAAAEERARHEAQHRAALTDAVLETIDVGIVACDADGRLTLFNRAARTFHGASADPTVDPAEWAREYSLFDEDGATPLPPDHVPLHRALADGEVRDAVMVIAPPGRPSVTVRCNGRSMRDGSGTLLGAVVAQEDVTEARAQARALTHARDTALAATRAKSAFLAAASHEIRTPLNGVLGMLEILAAGELTVQQRGYVDVAHRSGEALLHLLNDVLDLSKAETTAVALVARPFRPAEVAAEVVAALQSVAHRKGVDLELDLDLDLEPDLRLGGTADLTLVGDAPRLRQVLVNLVGNAVKFTDAGRVRLTVSLLPAPDPARCGLRLTVADTGPGMGATEVEQLFQPFTQGAQGRRLGGTGLGLALSSQLVTLMGGEITVVSEPGRGSTFTLDVELPVLAEAVAPSPDPVHPVAVPAVSGTGRPPRVLVADDNEVNLMVARALLESDGAEVTTVPDGDDAVTAVGTGDFDLVLLDMQMPRMSGLDAARMIRALPGPAGLTRLVALTANASAEDRAACSAAGMEAILVKPVRRADLRGLVPGGAG